MLLYIDPGTGSMLFSLVIGIAGAGIFFIRRIALKVKFIVFGGKGGKRDLKKKGVVIFSDHKRYWTVFKPICDEFEKRNIDVEFWSASPDDPALKEHYNHIKCLFVGSGNKAYAKLNMMNAHVVVATTPHLDVFQWRRSKNVDLYVHVFHSLSDGGIYEMFGLDYYDVILSTGAIFEKYERILEQKRNLPAKEIVTCGLTYLDVMQKKILKNQSKKDAEKITVLLAPSWGKSGILSSYGSRIIDPLLASGYAIIIRPHPQTVMSERSVLDTLMKHYPNSNILEWNFDNDNFDCLNRSDILISDFSRIVFDYALVFDKPVLYTIANYNSATYDSAWFDEPSYFIQCLPYIGQELHDDDLPDIRNAIQRALLNRCDGEVRKKLKNDLWACQGQAAMNIVDYIMHRLKLIQQSERNGA